MIYETPFTTSRRAVLAAPLALLTAGIARPLGTAAQERDYWPTKGWRAGDPAEQGIDPGGLAAAGDAVAAQLPEATGFVVIRNGYLVYERYYGDAYGRDDPVKIRSITKSVTSALIGMALEDELIDDLDQPIGDLIPDRIPDDADPLTPSITVRQMLTMTGGWAWDIGSDYERLIASEDWAEYTLSQPVVYEPGSFYAYNSGGSHILSVILSAVTEDDTVVYAQERLFRPIGIRRPRWQRSPQGERVGGFGLELTPRDLAKFGFLFLNGGVWEGEQLVPARYVRDATTYQATGDSTGFAAYGFQWWVTETPFGQPAYFGLGFGSQYLYVVPELDLIAVIVKGFEERPAVVTPSRPVIETYVVPAVRG